jgi:hypothetical protein
LNNWYVTARLQLSVFVYFKSEQGSKP